MAKDPKSRATGEPEALKRGKRFHRELQESWVDRHGGIEALPEQPVDAPPGGRAGRMDILIAIKHAGSEKGDTAPSKAVLELKDRDFDRMKPRSLRTLIRRDRRQILRYVTSLIDLSSSEPAQDGESDVMPAMIYRRSPSDPATRAKIEAFFDEEMIIVIWEDETEAEAKTRLG